jgi:hypothetical protein
MSIEEAKNFIRTGRSRQELRDEVDERLRGLREDEIFRVIAEMGRAHGFSFSPQDYTAAAEEMRCELSPEQLDEVVGGAGSLYFIKSGSVDGVTSWLLIASSS